MKHHGPRILVVDDDPASKEQLADLIQGEGWRFDVADTGEEALAAAGDLEPEVIVLDPRAEGGRAAALLVELRRRGDWVPVLLYSADPALDEQYALEHGASGAEKKPGGLVALRDRIARLLDARETDRPL